MTGVQTCALPIFGDQLTCIFVDNGVLRKNEREQVRTMFTDNYQFNLRVVDATDLFLGNLAGVFDPEEKRKRIGNTFIDVFKEEAASIDDVKFRKTVVPGDQLILEAELKRLRERTAQVQVKATVDGKTVTEATIRFMIVDAN